MLTMMLMTGLVLAGQEQAPGAAAAKAPRANSGDAGWAPLFNGRNLDGWYTFLQVHGKDRDPDRVITIEDGAIRLYQHADDGSKVVMGYIATAKDYGNYHLRFRYR